MKRRGSALVYVIIMVFAITSVVLVSAKMSSASEREFRNTLEDAQFKSMADGAVAETIAECYKETMSTGNRVTTFTTASLTTNARQHSTLARAYELEITGTVGDRQFSTTRTIGKRQRPHPAYYGLWVNSDYSDSLLATVVNGSVYMAGNATLSGPWTVTDDFLVRGTSAISVGSSVGGTYMSGVRVQTMPTFTYATYSPEATAISANNQSNFVFSGLDAQAKYPMLGRSNNFTMNGGTISGKGTVVVGGNLSVNGNYNYADTNSRAVILVVGNLVIGAATTQLAGTYIVLGRVTINSVNLNVVRGNICTGQNLARLTAALTITQDDVFVENSNERILHRLPGYFP
jgi:hypothetical protein